MPAQQCCAFFQICELSGLELGYQIQEDVFLGIPLNFGDMLEPVV